MYLETHISIRCREENHIFHYIFDLHQTKARFIQGFKLDFELTTELQTYDATVLRLILKTVDILLCKWRCIKMKKKAKITLAATTLMILSLMIISPRTIPQEHPQIP